MNDNMEFSFKMSNKEIERIKNILTSGGLRHYLLKIANDEELDVVEYKEYQKLEKENQELKKQLEIASHNYTKYIQERDNTIEKIKNQQKEFIEYLTDYIDALEQQEENIGGLDIAEEHILMVLEENLQKYKEIIGDRDER